MQKFQERFKKRQEELERKRQERQENKHILETMEENSVYFQKKFTTLLSNIQSEFDILKLKSEKTQNDFQKIYDKIKELSNYTSESLYFLNSYEQTQANEKIQQCLTMIQSYEQITMRKRKTFQSIHKKVIPTTDLSDINDLMSKLQTKESINKEQVSNNNAYNEYKENQIITEYKNNQDLELSNYKFSFIYIKETLLSVSLKNLSQSVIILTHIDGSLYVESCHQCILLIRAKQIRIHDSDSLHFSLFIINNPILENSNQLYFSPLLSSFLFHDSLSSYPNAYDQVKDFNWFKTQPSPHFQVLKELEDIEEYKTIDSDIKSYSIQIETTKLGDIHYIYQIIYSCLHSINAITIE